MPWCIEKQGIGIGRLLPQAYRSRPESITCGRDPGVNKKGFWARNHLSLSSH
jgi:hypothetical protein